MPPLLEALSPPLVLDTVAADGAYAARGVCDARAARGVRYALILPHPTARRWRETTQGAALRNANLEVGTKDRDFVPGGAVWLRVVGLGYRVRSLVETTFSRLAAMGGNRLRVRSATGQAAEIHTILQLLNEHARRGLPERVRRATNVRAARVGTA